jgi:hypothetical protein
MMGALFLIIHDEVQSQAEKKNAFIKSAYNIIVKQRTRQFMTSSGNGVDRCQSPLQRIT